MQTHPFSYNARKAQIMSKYRPIAPKPSPPLPTSSPPPPPLPHRPRKKPNTNTKSNHEVPCLRLFPLHGGNTTSVIAPQAVRPVCSSISVRCMKREEGWMEDEKVVRLSEEVEKEVELEELPAVISDSCNRVRMTNNAYKELVGQPECVWVDSGRGGRIEGVVELRFCEEKMVILREVTKGFSCWVAIEWEGGQEKKKCVSTFCHAIRVACVSRDYAFAWRFHTTTNNGPAF